MFPCDLQFSWRDLWSLPIVFLYFLALFIKKVFLSLLAIFWNSAFTAVYLFFPQISVKPPQTTTLPSSIFFLFPTVLVNCHLYNAMNLRPYFFRHCLPDLIPWIYSSPLLYNHKGVDPGKNSGVGCHLLLQRSSQGSNLCLLCLLHWQAGSLPLVLLGNTQNLNGLVLFPTFFNLSLNFAIRSSWPKSQSAPSLLFPDCIQLLYLWLQRT